ncbi:Phosphatidate phosphatase PPAPDC1B [Trametes pubescens]|uniref:Phosphatidate phosphatase PPAPDC1B n=1 Tax=Trametes pubescens TaxID=154538 RepID=A0A1M2VUE8_TRAPU|nr:Phosphatidate phosphatase PPAPDC1B [Trametes pubescens]
MLTYALRQVKAWLALAPLAGAAMVAISRTMDYRHHWQDVLTGSLLGLVTAYFSYRQFYPPLWSDMSHKPYSPRIKRGSHLLPTHTRDPSEAEVLAEIAPNRGDIRPRPERRYTDRPSIGDETTMATTTRPAESIDGVDTRKESWRETRYDTVE